MKYENSEMIQNRSFKKLRMFKGGAFAKWSRFLGKRERALFVLYTFLGGITGYSLVVFNLLSSLAITAIFNGENQKVWWLTAAFFIYLGADLLLSIIKAIILVRYREKLRETVSKEIINSLWENTDYATIRGGARNLLGQLDRDLEKIVSSSSTFSEIIWDFLEIISILIIIVFINPYAALFIILLGLLLQLLPPLIGGKFAKIGAKLSTIHQSYSNIVQQLVRGLKIYLFQGKENLISQRLEAISHKKINETIKLSLKQQILQGSMIGVLGIISLTLSLMAGLTAYYGIINLSLVLLFSNYMGIVQARIQQIHYSLNDLNSNLPLIERLKPAEKTEPIILENLQKIKLKKVSVNYQNKEFVNNLNLTFEKGGKYAIVGPSGAGKSTLTYLLLGLLNPSEGSLSFNDIDSLKIEKSSLRNLINIIGSTHNLLPNHSIRENLLFERDKSPKEEKIASILSQLNLAQFIDRIDEPKLVGLLSTGERQRLLIARALLENRPLLILDEALANLDKTNRKNIENFLLSQKDLTLIHITHHLWKSEGYDQIIELKKVNYAQN